LTQIAFVEGSALSERQAAAQFFIGQRLIGWLEGNTGNGKAFILKSFFEKGVICFRRDRLSRPRLTGCRKRTGEQDEERGC
jgi:hypothetical protein